MVFDKREEPRRYNDYFYEKQFALIDDKGQNECDKIKKLLDFFIEQLHNSLAIADGKGVFVRVSRSWEKEHGVSAKDVIGIHAYELEQQGVFRPSVTLAVMEKKCRIEMLQYNKNGAKILVSGIPIFNNRGGIDWIVSYSSWDVSNSKGLKEKYDELMVMMKRYSTEIEELRKRGMKIPGIISKSPQMESILDLISRIASEDINVLITGETGVGKNLIARNIHRVSKRNEGPFIEINCGAIPENLIESELFG